MGGLRVLGEVAVMGLQIPDAHRHIDANESLPEFRNSLVRVKRMAIRSATSRAEGPTVIVKGSEVDEENDGKGELFLLVTFQELCGS